MGSQRVAIFGMGAIGRAIVDGWDDAASARLVAICVRPHQVADLQHLMRPDVTVVSDVAAMLATNPDVVVEAAGHDGALAIAAPVLTRADLYLLSVGILADAAIRAALLAVARANGHRIVIPAGALAGFDGLAALARTPGTRVKYTSIKPPRAWVGTPAATAFDLDAMDTATTIFAGNAEDAARLYPRNANLAAAVALAGIGFADTQVELIADPASLANRGIVEAHGPSSSLTLEAAGLAALDNPKTSAIVADSVLAALDNRWAEICFG